MMKSRIIFSILMIFGLINSSKGQETIFFDGDFKPVVIWIYPEGKHDEVFQQVGQLKEYQRKKYKWLLLSDSLNSKPQIVKKINDYLNKESSIEKQKIYILEWGDSQKNPYFENKSADIIADSYFFDFSQGLKVFDLETVLRKFDSQYIWGITVSEVEEKSLLSNPQIKKFSYGITLGKAYQNIFKEDSAYLPPSMTKVGFNVGYRINPRFYLLGRGMFSFKIPDQDGIQSSLFSQIDIAAGGIQKVSIEMKAHVFLEGSLQATYFLTKNQRFQPYLGAGLAYVNFKSAKVKEETEIDLSNIFSGGGLPTGVGDLGGIANGDLPFFTGSTVAPIFSGGVSVKLGKNIRWMTSADFQYANKKELEGIKIENRHQAFSISSGLLFEFNKRQKKYYQYFGF